MYRAAAAEASASHTVAEASTTTDEPGNPGSKKKRRDAEASGPIISNETESRKKVKATTTSDQNRRQPPEGFRVFEGFRAAPIETLMHKPSKEWTELESREWFKYCRNAPTDRDVLERLTLLAYFHPEMTDYADGLRTETDKKAAERQAGYALSTTDQETLQLSWLRENEPSAFKAYTLVAQEMHTIEFKMSNQELMLRSYEAVIKSNEEALRQLERTNKIQKDAIAFTKSAIDDLRAKREGLQTVRTKECLALLEKTERVVCRLFEELDAERALKNKKQRRDDKS